MKIEGKIQVLNIENWNTDWSDDSEKREELRTLIIDMRKGISERCGIDIHNIEINLNVVD